MQLNKKRYLSSKHQVDELAQSYNTTKLLAVFISFLILYMLKLHHASPAVIHIDVGLPVEQPLWQCHSGPHRRQCAAQYRRQGWCCKSNSQDVTLQVNSIEMCSTKIYLQPQSIGKFQNLAPEWSWFGNLHSNCTSPQSKMNITLSFQAYPWANAKTSATYGTF